MREFRCGKCGSLPNPREQARINSEGRTNIEAAVGWLCPACAPELRLTRSGLTFHVVDVRGSSPRYPE